MAWGPSAETNIQEYVAGLPDTNNGPFYIMLWNEPDMTGGMLGCAACPCNPFSDCDPSGCGIIPSQLSTLPDGTTTSIFAYGCGVKDGITSVAEIASETVTARSGFANSADYLAQWNNWLHTHTQARIATPAMANEAWIKKGCAGWGVQADYSDWTSACTPFGDNDPDLRIQPCYACSVQQKCDCEDDDPPSCAYCSNPGSCTCGAVFCTRDENGGPSPYPNGCNGDPVVWKGDPSDATCTTACSCKNCGTFASDFAAPGGCRCNGWLSVLKNAMGVDWNDPVNGYDIINMHAYGNCAHTIKLRILGYLKVFQSTVRTVTYSGGDPGAAESYVLDATGGTQEVWLTEVACVYNKNQEASGATAVVTRFIQDLLYSTTVQCTASDLQTDKDDCTADDAMLSDEKSNTVSLPGLLTNGQFSFNGATKTWYEHGFGGFTWFAASHFPGFQFPCTFDDDFADSIESSVWDGAGQLNEIWAALLNNT